MGKHFKSCILENKHFIKTTQLYLCCIIFITFVSLQLLISKLTDISKNSILFGY